MSLNENEKIIRNKQKYYSINTNLFRRLEC